MNTRADSNGNNGTNGNNSFVLGLITGGVVGAAMAIAFAPRLARELRQRVTAAAGDLGDAASSRYRDATTRVADVVDAASSRYRDATTRVADVVDDLTARGQAVRDEAADAVVRGAREVEHFAKAAKSDARRS